MSESFEHAFLKERFLEILKDFSKLELYGYKEVERKKFDFSCILKRDLSRPLVGQAVWKHTEGIDKDIRMLLTDSDSEIKAYIARDTMKHRLVFEEIMNDFRRSGYKDLFKVKVFWIPQDFDGDSEEQRQLVVDKLKSSVVKDILFGIVFGRLSEYDIRLFLDVTGIVGVNLVLLYEIATNGFINIAELSRRLNISAGPIREKLIVLRAAGFLTTQPHGGMIVSPKGKAFLEIINRLYVGLQEKNLNPELIYLLNRLGCQVVSQEEVESSEEIFPENPYIRLVKTMNYTVKSWKINLGTIKLFSRDS